MVLTLCLFSSRTGAQPVTAEPTLHIQANHVTAHVSPQLYGLMTEEINYSYEGGLYGELIRNRTFKADPQQPTGWQVVGSGNLSLDESNGLNAALDLSLRLDASGASPSTPAGMANTGYWGIPVRPQTTYNLSFFAKCSPGYSGPLVVRLENADGSTLFAQAVFTGLTTGWNQFHTQLVTQNAPVGKDNRLTLSTSSPGTIWFQQVSLFPPTYDQQPNGDRPDIMNLLAAMKPAFLRLPGGNYLEGDHFESRFNWKNTIGKIEDRPGHESPWGYWSTDGFGLMEYMMWCENLHMEPLLAVFAGYTLRHEHAEPGPELAPYVQDALDEIQYVAGPTNTTWGALRARDGHPAPFPLHYIEVGNEDWFDRSGSYDGRFAQFFKAIKSAYPDLKIIATAKVKSVTPDLLDEHYYRSEEEMEAHAHDYDRYSRENPTKIFVGEWATRVGSPTPNMAGALGDAAWMTGMERNSDIVRMASYAPLFVNVSDLGKGGSMQWRSDLIGYDALTSYGSPSYYAQVMFSNQHGDDVLETSSSNIGTYLWQPKPRHRNGEELPAPPPQQVPTLFFDATRNASTGDLFLKVVNRSGTDQKVRVLVDGSGPIQSTGVATVLQGDSPDATNSLQDPMHIVPHSSTVSDLGENFEHSFPAYSITILKLASSN